MFPVRHRRTLTLLFGLFVTFVMTGCTPIARTRTLPPSVRKVYVPMFINRTAEPGVEEKATVATEEEFLADGRLGVVNAKDADAVVEVTLQTWRPVSLIRDNDSFTTIEQMQISAAIDIRENVPGKPLIGARRVVTTRVGYSSDKRKVLWDPEPRVREAACQALARAIVQEVLTGVITPAEYDKAVNALPDDRNPDEPSGI